MMRYLPALTLALSVGCTSADPIGDSSGSAGPETGTGATSGASGSSSDEGGLDDGDTSGTTSDSSSESGSETDSGDDDPNVRYDLGDDGGGSNCWPTQEVYPPDEVGCEFDLAGAGLAEPSFGWQTVTVTFEGPLDGPWSTGTDCTNVAGGAGLVHQGMGVFSMCPEVCSTWHDRGVGYVDPGCVDE